MNHLVLRSYQRFLPLIPRKRRFKSQKDRVNLQIISQAYQTILQSLMAKRWKHFYKTDQNTSQTKHPKKLDAVKKENWMSNSSKIQSIQIWSRRYEAYSDTILQKKPVVVKSLLESNCKPLRQCTLRANFNLKPETSWKLSQFNNGGNYNHIYNEVKEKL